MIARPENRFGTIDPDERRAAGAWLAFVARHRRVAKVRAARSLQDVSAYGRHVAQLTRCRKEQRLAHDWISLAHTRVPCHVSHVGECADAQSAARQLRECRERRVAPSEV